MPAVEGANIRAYHSLLHFPAETYRIYWHSIFVHPLIIMRVILIPLLAICCSSLCLAQNLVPNPGFENYSSLPDNWGQWDRVHDWTNAGGVPASGYYADPDYFHTSGIGVVQLPSTSPATLNAHTGDAVMGFLAYHDSTPGVANNVREYLSTELTSPLTIGQTYRLRFWITNGQSDIGHYYKCDGVGALLSVNAPHQNGASYIPATPQMVIAGELWSIGWTEHIFSFTADSAYRFLTFGNFVDDTQISYSVALQGPLPFAGAYYFLDDVNFANIEFQSAEDSRHGKPSISPNPTSGELRVQLPETNGKRLPWQLHDLSGRVQMAGEIQGAATLDLSDLPAGIYLLSIPGMGTTRVARQ